MNPGMMVLENNIERVPGAALLSITMTHFGHHDGHDGFLIGGTARFASWWRKFAPAQYQRREYGGPGGWPAEVLQFPRKYPWLGFRPPIFRGLHEG
jgi:hypothetical protein